MTGAHPQSSQDPRPHPRPPLSPAAPERCISERGEKWGVRVDSCPVPRRGEGDGGISGTARGEAVNLPPFRERRAAPREARYLPTPLLIAPGGWNRLPFLEDLMGHSALGLSLNQRHLSTLGHGPGHSPRIWGQRQQRGAVHCFWGPHYLSLCAQS